MIDVQLGDWEALRREAEPIRNDVFVIEQGVPAEIEIDDQDPVCIHAIARDAHGKALATGRLLPDGHIGRMAVRSEARGSGVGARVLEALIEAARARGDREAVLSAQTHACGFYEKFGFERFGDVYLDAGIDHVDMRRILRT